jgi:hypothetical protein
MSKRRGLLMAFVTALLAGVAAATLAIAPAHGAGFTPINIWNSSHCMDNPTANAARVQMWSCNGSSPQKWLEGFNPQTGLFTFTNQNSRWCVTAPAGGPGAVTMAPCDASAAAQQWSVFFADNPLGPPSGWYDVWQNASSGLCLTTNSVANGTVLQMAGCDPSDQYDRWHQQ